jgi:hypothetical protein
MLMWGLALRHGWGVPKDEKGAFSWLRRAAESATGDLERKGVKGKGERDALKKELILAIYEVGQCFFHGWGVPKDQKMAVVSSAFFPRRVRSHWIANLLIRAISPRLRDWVIPMLNKSLPSATSMVKARRRTVRRQPNGIEQRYVPFFPSPHHFPH